MTNSEAVVAQLASRFGTQDPSKLQVQRWCFYDYVRYPAAGTTQLTFFTNPVGATDPVSGLSKTYEQTNLRRSGQFEDTFIISQIKTHIYLLPKQRQNATLVAVTDLIVNGYSVAFQQALWALAHQGVFNMSFGQKNQDLIEQPFCFCPPGAGVDIGNVSSNGAGLFFPQSVWFQQSANPKDIYAEAPPVLVEKDQYVTARIDFPATASPALPQVSAVDVRVDIGLMLEGYIIRPVQ